MSPSLSHFVQARNTRFQRLKELTTELEKCFQINHQASKICPIKTIFNIPLKWDSDSLKIMLIEDSNTTPLLKYLLGLKETDYDKFRP